MNRNYFLTAFAFALLLITGLSSKAAEEVRSTGLTRLDAIKAIQGCRTSWSLPFCEVALENADLSAVASLKVEGMKFQGNIETCNLQMYATVTVTNNKGESFESEVTVTPHYDNNCSRM